MCKKLVHDWYIANEISPKPLMFMQCCFLLTVNPTKLLDSETQNSRHYTSPCSWLPNGSQQPNHSGRASSPSLMRSWCLQTSFTTWTPPSMTPRLPCRTTSRVTWISWYTVIYSDIHVQWYWSIENIGMYWLGGKWCYHPDQDSWNFESGLTHVSLLDFLNTMFNCYNGSTDQVQILLIPVCCVSWLQAFKTFDWWIDHRPISLLWHNFETEARNVSSRLCLGMTTSALL